VRKLLAVAVLLASTAACAPKEEVHLSVRDLSSDVVYGDQSKPKPPPPIPAASIRPTFPSFIQPPSPPPRPGFTPPPPKEPCPAAAVDAFPVVEASPRVRHAPAPATYVFRQSGEVTIGTETFEVPPVSFREIADVVEHEDGTITFDVIEDQLVLKTTTSYLIDQTSNDSAFDGIFITQVVTAPTKGEVEQFTPQPAIRILPLPVQVSAEPFVSAGTDALRGMSMSLEGTVVERGRVDACGTVLDAWKVHATIAVTSATMAQTYESTFDMGTQFGGIVLSDHLVLSGLQSATAVSRDTTAIITQSPPLSEEIGE
jgi:hypothetical protein